MKTATGPWWKTAFATIVGEGDGGAKKITPDQEREESAEQTGAAGKNRGEGRPSALTAEGGAAALVDEVPSAAVGTNGDSDSDSDSAPRKRSSRRGRRSRGRRRGKTVPGDAAAETPDEEPAQEDMAEEEEEKVEVVEKAPSRSRQKSGNCLLLINADEPEECRIAQVENGKVEQFHIATVGRERIKSNIYKGVVTTVEMKLQAVFVDIGMEKNGFLPFGEIHPEYFVADMDEDELNELRQTHWKDLKMQDFVRPGQEMLVQVVKETGGSKGPHITTYLSLPGRFLVLMPGSDSSGISRKIEDEEQRARLRTMMQDFSMPPGIGYIIRTASQEITKTGLQKDLRYLLRLWETVKERGQTQRAPSLVYQDQELIGRFLRDYYDGGLDEIVTDTREAFDQVKNFLGMLPGKQGVPGVRLHSDSRPLFSCFKIEEQIEQIYQPMVKLPSGGSIVINPTEALVAIDVNSGRTSKDQNFDESIFLANKEAAAELARQLRLRDLGGLIVVDFIDMRLSRHIREVEKELRDALKRDKAKCEIGKISKFGLMQISRQKMGSPVEMGSHRVCPTCQGRGVVRSTEAQALIHLRRLQFGLARRGVARVRCLFPMEVAFYLLNRKKEDLLDMEKKNAVEIAIEGRSEMRPSESEVVFFNGQGETLRGA